MAPLRWLLALIASAIVLAPLTAAAEGVVGLDIDLGEISQTPLGSDLLDSIDDAFADDQRYRWISPSDARARLSSSLLGCRDEDCLLDIGDELDATAAIDIDLSVSSQIYEGTIQIWDLEAAEPLATRSITCELCGDSDIEAEFFAAIAGAIDDIDARDDRAPDPADTTLDEEPSEPGSQVRISVTPEDAKIFLDDDPVDRGDATLDLDVGEYELRFSHPDHLGLRETLIITEDSSPVFVFRVHLAAEPAGEERHVITRGDGWVDDIESRRSTIGWSAVGAGTALTFTSIALARRHGQPTCDDDVPVQRCPDVYNTATWSSLTGLVGISTLTAGVALLLWPRLAGEDQEPEPVSRGVQLQPSVSSQFSGVSLRGRF